MIFFCLQILSFRILVSLSREGIKTSFVDDLQLIGGGGGGGGHRGKVSQSN